VGDYRQVDDRERLRDPGSVLVGGELFGDPGGAGRGRARHQIDGRNQRLDDHDVDRQRPRASPEAGVGGAARLRNVRRRGVRGEALRPRQVERVARETVQRRDAIRRVRRRRGPLGHAQGRLRVELFELLGERAQIDLAADRLERRDGDRAERGFERSAAQQADPVGRVVDLAQPRTERHRDHPVFAAVRAEQRGEARVSRGDVPELAADEKAQLIVAEVLDELCRDHDRVRRADADPHHRNERVVAHEHVRRRHAQHPRALFDHRVHVRELSGVDAQTAAQQPAASERDVHHRDDDQQGQLGIGDLVLQHRADDEDAQRKREQRPDERRVLAADA